MARRDVSGSPDTSAYGNKMPPHLILSSYVADLPESEDFLSLRGDSRTKISCDICFGNKMILTSCKDAGKRNLHHERPDLKKLSNVEETKDAEWILTMLSMHAVPPVLHTFSFVGIHSCDDLYSIFGPQQMHVLCSFFFRCMQNVERVS